MYDLILRNGTVVDGTGGAPFTADVAAGCPDAHDVLINADVYRGVDLVGTQQFTFTVQLQGRLLSVEEFNDLIGLERL